MDKIVENFPTICNCFATYMSLPNYFSELRSQLQDIENKEFDMTEQLKAEKASNLCRKQKKSVGDYFDRTKSFRDMATKTLKKSGGGILWKRVYMIIMIMKLDKLLKEGEYLLKMANQLIKDGLTYNGVYTRGPRLPVGNLIGNTPQELQAKALHSIRSKAQVVGIHGNPGVGKTTLMKFLHNDVHDDIDNFKAVFWAGAPQEQKPGIKSIQDCLANAMKFKFEDEDVVRRSSLLAKKLKDMDGHVVLFLDNVKEPFEMDDIGIIFSCNEAENFCCTLVFTAASENVCNQMRCAVKYKMDLLPEREAKELFFHEACRHTYRTRNFCRRLEEVAVDVAKQCARMPLVIILIARSMTGKEELCEWKNRLNELMGFVENMHGDEAKILEQLKFSYNCIKDCTIRSCFIASASVLHEGQQLTRKALIWHWTGKRLICNKRRRGTSTIDPVINDRGDTIINELHRMYLLEVAKLDGTDYVSMNKWIRKMAEVAAPEEDIP